jgi:GntR family transcriptional regulator, carbon starvation induced regulator
MIKQKIRYKPDTTLVQQCFKILQDDIIEGRLKPGEKIKVMPLKAKFGVAQSPIREALSRLVAVGLVETSENKGFRVALISEANIRDIYATITLIENAALRLAIEKGGKEWQKNIKEEFKKLSSIESKKSRTYAEWSEQNYKFHFALISGCDSPELLKIQWNLYLKFERYVRMAHYISKDKNFIDYNESKRQDHIKLTELVLNREADEAVKLMSHHINAPLEDVIKILKIKKLF